MCILSSSLFPCFALYFYLSFSPLSCCHHFLSLNFPLFPFLLSHSYLTFSLSLSVPQLYSLLLLLYSLFIYIFNISSSLLLYNSHCILSCFLIILSITLFSILLSISFFLNLPPSLYISVCLIRLTYALTNVL